MPPARFASPFPKLNLSLEDREQLHATATALVDEAQALYESYLWDDKSSIDEAKWELIKTREDVRVYHDRRPDAGTGNEDMHLLLTVGTVLGTLNDAMYGVLNHTTDAMRIKTAYMKDTLIDSAVLETIAEPTIDDPFQSTTVRWFVKGLPLIVRMLLKPGDNVYMEATGMKQLRNGERVGFHLMHSLNFAQAPTLPMYYRFNMSVCTLWRQQSPTRVEAFLTSYAELKERFTVPVIIKGTAEALVSLWQVIECAMNKKLLYLVTHKTQFQQGGDNGSCAGAQAAEECGLCGTHSRSARRDAKSACAICVKAVCKTCRVKRELAFFSPDGKLLKQKLRFCLLCLGVAHRMDAGTIAAAEVPTKRRQYSGSVHSAPSTVSLTVLDHRSYSDSSTFKKL